MKQIADLLERAGWLQQTSFEPEEFILTPEEVQEILRHESERLRDWTHWKLLDKGQTPGEVAYKLADRDWLREVDRDEVLRKANANKHYAIWQQQQQEKRRKEQEARLVQYRETWTAKQILRLMRWTSKQEAERLLIENENTLPLIKTVCFFLSEDPRFETELGYSFKKGLWLRGICGVGKTHVVSCARKNELNPVKIFSLIEIQKLVKEDGLFDIPPLSGKIYIDDVGSPDDSVVNHYGTKINWFKEFVETFYLRCQGQYSSLIVSTNCTAMQIEEKYGYRVRSRVKDMFNIVDVEGVDLRGEQ